MNYHDASNFRLFAEAFIYGTTYAYYWGEPERAPHRRVCCEFSIYLFLYIYLCIVRRAVNHFLLVFCVSLRHALIQTTNELTSNVNDIDTNHERSTSTRMETIARGEGLYKAFHEDGKSASSDLMSCMQSTSWCALAS